MDIVTGHVGSAHVTSWQDRDLNQGIFGPDTYILNVGSKLAATIISNNEIRIADGTLVMQGCQGAIQLGTYDSISIDNGSSGMKRNDLICAEYTKVGGVESLGWTVIKGTPAASNPSDPSYTSGDIQNGDALVQVPIYRVSLNGLTVESVTALVDEAGTIAGGGSAFYQNGTISLASYSGFGGSNLLTVTLPAGTYIVSVHVHVEADVSSLKCWVLEGGFAYGSTFMATGQYESNASAVAVVSNTIPLIVQMVASQSSGSPVSCFYQIVYKRIG